MSDTPAPTTSHDDYRDPAYAHAHGGEHGATIGSLLAVYAILMLLLVATVGAAFIHLGNFNIVLAMLIAITKASLVVWIFMHVKYGGRLVLIFATAAFIWLGIMFAITFSDYFTRSRLTRADDQLRVEPREHSAVRHQPDDQPRKD
jgi:cytochrome c oxidase subunit 4